MRGGSPPLFFFFFFFFSVRMAKTFRCTPARRGRPGLTRPFCGATESLGKTASLCVEDGRAYPYPNTQRGPWTATPRLFVSAQPAAGTGRAARIVSGKTVHTRLAAAARLFQPSAGKNSSHAAGSKPWGLPLWMIAMPSGLNAGSKPWGPPLFFFTCRSARTMRRARSRNGAGLPVRLGFLSLRGNAV